MTGLKWRLPPGYYWKVVVDPTRTGDEPGMFYGGHFRWSDIVIPGWDKETRKIPCPWPSGTVFEHVRTGERVMIRHGRVVKERQASHGTADSRCRCAENTNKARV